MMQTGYITARVFTSNAQLPVEGATVSVTQRSVSGQVKLLGLRTTNENGEIEPVPLETPPRDQSTQPQEARPWATCDLTAGKPGYVSILVVDAQVFPEVTSLQLLQLVPLKEVPDSWSPTEVFSVYPQNL